MIVVETMQLPAVMNIVDPPRLVNLLLIDAAFKATDTYSEACEFILISEEYLIVIPQY